MLEARRGAPKVRLGVTEVRRGVTHTPLRRCRVCRRQAPKEELERWTVRAGIPTLDPAQTEPGRGYYSCAGKCSEILPKTIKIGKAK